MSEQEQQTQAETEQVTEPVQLPADHPLVKAYEATKAKNAELREKATRLDEIEEAQKTELEKAVARAEAAERWKSEREAQDTAATLVAEIANAKGVPASALRGSTKAELESHADELLALMPPKPKVATAASGGNRGEDIDAADELEETSPGMGSLRAGYEPQRKG